MQDLVRATDVFLEVMSSPLSSNEEVNACLQECFKFLPDSNEEQINAFMQRVFSLSNLPDLERASLAATICGYLVERGFPGDSVLLPLINLYESLLDKSRVFYDILFTLIKQIDPADEKRDEKIDKIIADLAEDREMVSQETYNAMISLDKFYACAVSFFSVSKDNFNRAKSRLEHKIAYPAPYNQGCYWLDKLFKVLFDESVVVIDIDRKIGFKGTLNGIVDNYQLQQLLMSLPVLNDNESAISEDDLAIISGEGEQSSENIIENKWNMYNLELSTEAGWEKIINNRDVPSLSVEFRNRWIWGEGTPADISIHDGYRVILLGIPSYTRSSQVQRAFKNLKSSIEVKDILSSEDIDQWLNRLK